MDRGGLSPGLSLIYFVLMCGGFLLVLGAFLIVGGAIGRTVKRFRRIRPKLGHKEVQNVLRTQKLVCLQNLNLSKFPILKEPSEVEYLYLDNNYIEEIPRDLNRLHPKLKILSLRNNCIDIQAPREIAHKKLEHLDLSKNKPYEWKYFAFFEELRKDVICVWAAKKIELAAAKLNMKEKPAEVAPQKERKEKITPVNIRIAMPELKSLMVNDTRGKGVDPDFLSGCSELEKLEIKNTEMMYGSKLIEFLHRMKNLQHLEISVCLKSDFVERKDEVASEELVQRHFPRLVTFGIYARDEKVVEDLLEMMFAQEKNSLKELKMPYVQIGKLPKRLLMNLCELENLVCSVKDSFLLEELYIPQSLRRLTLVASLPKSAFTLVNLRFFLYLEEISFMNSSYSQMLEEDAFKEEPLKYEIDLSQKRKEGYAAFASQVSSFMRPVSLIVFAERPESVYEGFKGVRKNKKIVSVEIVMYGDTCGREREMKTIDLSCFECLRSLKIRQRIGNSKIWFYVKMHPETRLEVELSRIAMNTEHVYGFLKGINKNIVSISLKNCLNVQNMIFPEMVNLKNLKIKSLSGGSADRAALGAETEDNQNSIDSSIVQNIPDPEMHSYFILEDPSRHKQKDADLDAGADADGAVKKKLQL